MLEGVTIENPLLSGLTEEKKPEPFSLVIFGAHGDLTKRKLIPAIYALYIQNLLPESFAILGSSRTAMTDEEFGNAMKESVIKYGEEIAFTEESWSRFSRCLYYRAGNATEIEYYDNLKQALDLIGKEHGTLSNHIFYLSTSPSLYQPIIKNLNLSGLAFKRKRNEPAWPRVVVEKPFGHDLGSARSLDELIHEGLNEHQVYRIDHYLGKETVQNIMCFRFANSIFEPLWNRKYIDHVQMTNAETIGVESRGPYYEEAGALKDMIQNHLMQLLALVAMEPPNSLMSEDTRDERTKVLKAIRPFKKESIEDYTVRGQYAEGFVLGNKAISYRQEDRVSPASNTETFAALKIMIDNWRWSGVPFYMRTGKRLEKRVTEIAVQFKAPPHQLFSSMSKTGLRDFINADAPNVLVMRIQPNEGISLKFATKQPGPTTQLRWLTMDFNYGTAFGNRTPPAYERLILDSLTGDPSLFARSDFVGTSWDLLQPVIDHWAKSNPESPSGRSSLIKHVSFPNYESGSWGPEASDQLIATTGHAWRIL
ncbi:MAG: glucose-6-phosphate dehydrogenase [Candidatus Obscuribacterales bacterium]|nr:glucose-6-phosphate dehydrogenase [Candidatus Obscuribacterales bacterium]